MYTIECYFISYVLVFSPLYVSNRRAYGTVVVCSSVVVSHGCIVAERCKIGPRLLLITNRKSHIGFQMT